MQGYGRRGSLEATAAIGGSVPLERPAGALRFTRVTTFPTSAAQGDAEASRPTMTTLELFAGAGGMAVGAHRAGFEIVDLVEINEACCETLRANADHMGWKNAADIDARDARGVDFTQYEGKISVLTAGAPCQPFSNGGRRKGRHDHRDMLPEVVRAVAESRPRAFVIENVRGLLFESSVGYLRSIMLRLRNPAGIDSLRGKDVCELGMPEPAEDDAYRVDYRLLNAADFGLAQSRPRLFIVGVAQDEGEFQWPTGQYSRESLVEDLRGAAYWSDHPEAPWAARRRARTLLPDKELAHIGERWRTLRDVMVQLGPPARSAADADDAAHLFVPGARLYGKHTGSRIDWVGKTVKAGVHGSPGGEHIVVTSEKRFRYLTVRECAELQGFPRDYTLPEKRTPAMRQLGNAVAVNVAEAINRAVRTCLEPTNTTT